MKGKETACRFDGINSITKHHYGGFNKRYNLNDVLSHALTGGVHSDWDIYLIVLL